MLRKLYHKWRVSRSIESYTNSFFKNGQSSASVSFIFGLFKELYNYAINKCENDPSSVHCRDSNSQPLDYQSPP